MLLVGLILSQDFKIGICLTYFPCCDKMPKQRTLNGKGGLFWLTVQGHSWSWQRSPGSRGWGSHSCSAILIQEAVETNVCVWLPFSSLFRLGPEPTCCAHRSPTSINIIKIITQRLTKSSVFHVILDLIVSPNWQLRLTLPGSTPGSIVDFRLPQMTSHLLPPCLYPSGLFREAMTYIVD